MIKVYLVVRNIFYVFLSIWNLMNNDLFWRLLWEINFWLLIKYMNVGMFIVVFRNVYYFKEKKLK